MQIWVTPTPNWNWRYLIPVYPPYLRWVPADPLFIFVFYIWNPAPDYTNYIIKVKLIIHVHIHHLQQINSLNFLHCVLFTPPPPFKKKSSDDTQFLVAAGRSSKFFGILWSNLPFICSDIKLKKIIQVNPFDLKLW